MSKLLLAAAVVAAATSSAASAIPKPVAAHALLAAPRAAPSGAAAAATGGRHADRALEALLPSSLGGRELTVESQAGTDLFTRSAPFDAFLASLGKTRAAFSLASAYASGLRAEVGAWQIKDADPAGLLPGFKAAVQASSATPLTLTEETLAGHAVTRIGDPGQLSRGPLYVIVLGEALMFVQTPERALAEEAIGKLPH